MITAYIDPKSADALSAALNNILATSKKDKVEVVNQQARLWAEQAMAYTPPFAGGKIPTGEKGGNTTADKKAGVEAVKNDILKTMTPPSSIFRSGFTDKWLEKVIKDRDQEKMRGYLEKVKSPKLNKYKVEQFDPQLHRSKRVKGGRYRPDHQYKMVLDEKFVKKYQGEVGKLVGYMKAGWAVAVVKLGGTVAKWISDHIGYAKGYCDVLENTDTIYSVKIANSTPTIARHASNYNVVTRMRANAMVRQFKSYLDSNVRRNLPK